MVDVGMAIPSAPARREADGAIRVVRRQNAVALATTTAETSSVARLANDDCVRRFDTHPVPPVLATANDPAAVRLAILRRVAAVHPLGEEPPPHPARCARTTILKMKPHAPCLARGAAPSDSAIAGMRRRRLDLGDAVHLAAVVETVFDARRRRPAGSIQTRGPVH